MSDYKVAKLSEGINPHILYSSGIFVFFSAAFFGLWLLLMRQWPHLAPNDPEVQIRYLLGKGTAVICALWILLGVLQVLDIKSNGNLLGRIYRDSMACAVFTAAVLVCVTYLVSFL